MHTQFFMVQGKLDGESPMDRPLDFFIAAILGTEQYFGNIELRSKGIIT